MRVCSYSTDKMAGHISTKLGSYHMATSTLAFILNFKDRSSRSQGKKEVGNSA